MLTGIFLVGVLHLFPRQVAIIALLSKNAFFIDQRVNNPAFQRWCRFNAIVAIGGSTIMFIAVLVSQRS